MENLAGRYLVLTANELTWPKKTPILFIGNWCITSERRLFCEDLDFLVVPYHFDDRKLLYTAYEYCQKIHEKLLDDLTTILNEIFEIDNDKMYWRILLGYWLWNFVVVFYDRYLSLRNVLNTHINIETTVLNKKSYIITESTIEFFGLTATDDNFNLQIYSQIWESINGNIQNNIIIEHTESRYAKKGKVGIYQNLFNFQIFQWFNRVLMSKADVLTFRTYIQKTSYIKWFFKLKGKIFPLEMLIDKFEKGIPIPEVDYESRNNLKINLKKLALKNDDEFYRICLELISANIPISIFERYSNIKNTIKKVIKKTPTALISANGFINDVWNIISAEKANAGTKLINTQHGGGYGIQLFDGSEKHESEVADIFITMGWGGNPNKNKYVPMPCPIMNQIKFNTSVKNGKILIIGNDYCRYFFRMFSHPIGKYVSTYRMWFDSFLDYLDDNVSSNTLVRLYPVEYDGGRHKAIKQKHTKLQFDDYSRSFNYQLAQCKVAVSDNNQTTYLQSMAMNIPTIVFWNPKSTEIRLEAQPFIDDLSKVKILHYSPESAATFLNQNFNTISEWWNSTEVQETRLRFVSNYALLSKNWENDWIKFFETLD